MPKNQYTPQISAIHNAVMQKVQLQKPTSKWGIYATNIIAKLIFIISFLASLSLAIWFTNNLINNRPLLIPSLFDISGIEWVWSPELLGLAVLFYYFALSTKALPSLNSLKLAGLATVFALAIFVNLAFQTPTTQALQTNIKTPYNNLPLRQLSRDNHINTLLNNHKFYGLVISQTNKEIQINHGGVVRSFAVSKGIPNLNNQIIEVTFYPASDSVITYNILN
jgi:hypothetical protein